MLQRDAEPGGQPPTGENSARASLTARIRRLPGRWLGLAMLVAGLGMIPWLAGLAVELPDSARAAHWAAVWTGLDSLEAVGLAATGLLLIRRDARYRLTAMATATLLAVDAWFDVLTSAAGADRTIAIAMAAFPELPVSALCVVLALRRFPPTPATV